MRQKPMAAAPVSLVQNLEDAGCGPELVKEFLARKETGDVNGQMRLLRIHRQCLLDEVHTGEKQIDCLDYLVYQMGKENAV